MNIINLLKGFLKFVSFLATITTMFACLIFIGFVDPPEIWSKIGSLALIAWVAISGVCTLLMIDKED